MEQQYRTNNPIVFASVAVMIFVFTSILFIIYGSKVERQQQVIVSTAARSNAVLSSLFPSSVRDKLLQQQDNNITNVVGSSSTVPAIGAGSFQSPNHKYHHITKTTNKNKTTGLSTNLN